MLLKYPKDPKALRALPETVLGSFVERRELIGVRQLPKDSPLRATLDQITRVTGRRYELIWVESKRAENTQSDGARIYPVRRWVLFSLDADCTGLRPTRLFTRTRLDCPTDLLCRELVICNPETGAAWTPGLWMLPVLHAKLRGLYIQPAGSVLRRDWPDQCPEPGEPDPEDEREIERILSGSGYGPDNPPPERKIFLDVAA